MNTYTVTWTETITKTVQVQAPNNRRAQSAWDAANYEHDTIQTWPHSKTHSVVSVTTDDIETANPTKTYRLPKRFYDDHIERDCLEGVFVRETKSHIYIELDSEEYGDLLSDADYYSDASQFEPDMMGLVSSARATYSALIKQGAPDSED